MQQKTFKLSVKPAIAFIVIAITGGLIIFLPPYFAKATTQDYLGYKAIFCEDILGDSGDRRIIAPSGAASVSTEDSEGHQIVMDGLADLTPPGKYQIDTMISLLDERRDLGTEFEQAQAMAWEKYLNVCFFCEQQDLASGKHQGTDAEWNDFNSYFEPLRTKLHEIDIELLDEHERITNLFTKDLGLSDSYMCPDEEELRETLIRN